MRVLATAGHVDHGKSSLVLALTGVDPDRFAEEKRRGLTIDLGFAHLRLPSGDEAGLVDVPGHVRFVRNMLAGVGGIDACLFVVAATEGWKPQSEEHLRILQMLGITDGVVVLTKADLVDDDWCELVRLDLADRVAGTFLADAPVVVVSARTGSGLDTLRDELTALLRRTPGAVDRGRPRLWVDRSFAARGSGTVVTGTLTGGPLRVDQRVDVVPADRSARIRSLQVHGVDVDHVAPGTRLAVNLVGVDHHEITRGDAVVLAHQWRPTRRVDATLDVLGSLGHEVSRRGAYTLHVGSGEWPVKLRVLAAPAIAPGTRGTVRLHLQADLPLVRGDRFVVRESGRDETVGGGVVLDVAPVLPASKARPDTSVERIVREHGWIRADDLAALTGDEMAPTIGDWVVDPDALRHTVEQLGSMVAAADDRGVDLAALDDRQRAVLAVVPDIRVADGRVRRHDALDRLADHPLLAELHAGGTSPPDVDRASLPPDDRAALRDMIRRGLVIDRDGVLFHQHAIDLAAHAVAGLLAEHPDGVTMSVFRQHLGITRKHALPLMNELDARGITRRRDDVRIGGPRLPSP